MLHDAKKNWFTLEMTLPIGCDKNCSKLCQIIIDDVISYFLWYRVYIDSNIWPDRLFYLLVFRSLALVSLLLIQNARPSGQGEADWSAQRKHDLAMVTIYGLPGLYRHCSHPKPILGGIRSILFYDWRTEAVLLACVKVFMSMSRLDFRLSFQWKSHNASGLMLLHVVLHAFKS